MPNKREMFRPRQCRMSTGKFIGPDGQEKKAYCNQWGCPDCGPAKKRKFLWQMNVACGLIQQGGKRWRGMTLTLSANDGDDNRYMGVYWNRFRNSMKKAGYDMKHFIWVKEYQPGTGMLHLHVLIAAFIPWAVIKYYWIRAVGATPGKDYRHTWISAASIRSTAAYMAKYMSEDLDNSRFRKGERRYGMSRNMREYWPKTSTTNVELLKSTGYVLKGSNPNILPIYQQDGVYKAWWRLDGITVEAPVKDSHWKYQYQPDNSYFVKRAFEDLAALQGIRKLSRGWDKNGELKPCKIKRSKVKYGVRRLPARNKSNLTQ